MWISVIKFFYHSIFLTKKHSNPKISNVYSMPKVHKRKYEKIDEAEIDLVVKCNDSHEFYERYREVFPNKKKGIDSISKIWKRRGEFLKKQQDVVPSTESGTVASFELEVLVAAQNKILSELSAVMREQLHVSREILDRLSEPLVKTEAHIQKHNEERSTESKLAAKKQGSEKPADILIGS
jgi:hypothetical protein